MKLLSNFVFSALAIVGLAQGDFSSFMLFGVLASLTASLNMAHLAACAVSCELTDITSSDDCNIRGGLKTVYWARYSEIDWAAIVASPTHWDGANQTLLQYIMVNSATFKKLTFERKQGSYDCTYTEDTDVYEIVVTMVFEGKSAAIRNAFAKAVGCCKIVLHIFDNNCLERVIGVEWDGNTFEPQVKTLRVTRHLDSSGSFGDSKARDELDLGGESLTPPIFATVEETNIPVA